MEIKFDEQNAVAYVTPNSPFTVEDFQQFSALIDPYISQHGFLKGLVIEARKFPGWQNIYAFKAHMKFIKTHQAHIKKIALVTDSKLAVIMKNTVGFFIQPEIKHFPIDQLESANQWVLQ